MKHIIQLTIATVLIMSCQTEKVNTGLFKVEVSHPEWSKNAVIYEVYIRQYTREGTFRAFQEHLPRLKDLGIDIIWLMPIHPIGEVNRKGPLGSPYAIKDYKDINPEYGTMEDFKELVKEIHKLDMKIIIDYVANHTAFDNHLKIDHPEYYVQDENGLPVSEYDWTDVIKLNYDKPELWDYMIGVMKFWIQEADIDGFRCDMAGMVRQEFWETARATIDSVKPVYMIAEDQDTYTLLSKSFDANYSWELHHLTNSIARQEAFAHDLLSYFEREDSIYPSSATKMRFITNHDENKNAGSEFERMGEAVDLFAVFTFTIPGLPLIYNGQEIGMKRRLGYDHKDSINWNVDNKYPEFYKALIKLKKENPSLSSGSVGGVLQILNTNNQDVFAFKRYTEENEVLVFLNLSPKKINFNVEEDLNGEYSIFESDNKIKLRNNANLELGKWGYKIFYR